MGGKIGVAIIGSALSATLPSEHRNIDLYSSDPSPDDNTSYTHLLARPDISALIIALPILVQPDFIKQALQAGKHVLAEKPLAKDVETGRDLIAFYHKLRSSSNVTFGVAEQFRYFSAFHFGAAKAREMGRVLGFRHRLNACVGEGNKYFGTEWRRTPGYQGGFLLGGGVHFVAGMRMLLGFEAQVARVSAFTARLQLHLPPVDIVDAALKFANGGTGSFSVSFGTTFSSPAEWSIACEKGSVSISGSTVRVRRFDGGEEEVVVVEKIDEGGGVRQEGARFMTRRMRARRCIFVLVGARMYVLEV
ncbi:NAD(P)-binding protein [Teratosphaeria nubilosa]|uniref:NAD(P)-binding protein n=1 Tax=Teratosphaeria nubilosa TaxID=161662 RepID=A0A6G1L673_9PEZI|nr:NAD(P)-binding protein [Teratosphaeria nubilosa]